MNRLDTFLGDVASADVQDVINLVLANPVSCGVGETESIPAHLRVDFDGGA